MKPKAKANALIKQSELTPAKAKTILKEFEDYFDLAEEWEAKAKAIVVTDASQVADMKMARIGRLALRDKRVALEKRRKALKASLLREGKAIDGIANVLKALIAPIEEHLDAQEHFVERQEEARQAEVQKKVEAQMEKDRLAQQEDERRARAKLEAENRKLREEKAEADRKYADEAAARQKAQMKADQDKRLAEKQRQENEKRHAAELAALVTCPACGHEFSKDDPF